MSVMHPHHSPIAKSHARGCADRVLPAMDPERLRAWLLEQALAELWEIEDAIVHNKRAVIESGSIWARRIGYLLGAAKEGGVT